MTERWRKKLGDLDKQSPSDEVFERAKEGPMHAEEPVPRLKTSTRIITAAAAFAVFALAISVFAIPALRLQTGAAGGPSGLFPLWPSQTPDQLRQLQSEADAGSASWALDPAEVARRFGAEVMGWPDASVSRDAAQECSPPWLGSSPSPSNDIGWCADTGNMPYTAVPYPGSSSSYGADPQLTGASPSIGVDGAFLSFRLQSCDDDPTVCDRPVTETLTLYQPLEQGEEEIWAVLRAESAPIHLSVATGQNVRSGSSIAATFMDGETPTLGYATCGSSGASSNSEEIIPGERVEFDVELSGSAECQGAQAGYVWAASSSAPMAGEDGSVALDPLEEGYRLKIGLTGLTAVPVVMTFPEAEPVTTAMTSPTPDDPPSSHSATAGTWTSYSDPLGWTIDMPSGWLAQPFHSTGNVSVDGVHFASGDVTHEEAANPVDAFFPDAGEVMLFVWHEERVGESPVDDSSMPLSWDPASGYEMDFRADGLPYSILIKPGEGSADITAEQAAILERMVASIRFESWKYGEVRHGFISVNSYDSYPPGQVDMQLLPNGVRFVTVGTNDGVSAVVLDDEACESRQLGETAWEVKGSDLIQLRCGSDPSTAEYDLDGQPASGTIAPWDAPLDLVQGIRAWDGTVLFPVPHA